MDYQAEIIGRHKLTMYRAALELRSALFKKMPAVRLSFGAGFEYKKQLCKHTEIAHDPKCLTGGSNRSLRSLGLRAAAP
jgi:hypothetical protein